MSFDKEKQKGISLVILMIMVVFVGIMVVGIHAFLAENIRLSSVEKYRARALYLAEAGLSDSFWELKYSEKLYGPPSQPYGEIDQRTVNFYDGTSGTYSVPEPTDSIVCTGTYKGIVRKLKVGIDSLSIRYVFFAGSYNDFTFSRNSSVVGSTFVNGSVTVTTPTNIDTAQMKLYLPPGATASYSGGGDFLCTTIDPPPSLPDLNTSYYDNLLSTASFYPAGDSNWTSNRSLPETVYVNGNLTIANNKSISTSGDSSIVVVTGSITVNQRVDFSDNITLIANSGISLDRNVDVGTTTGLSGNLLFTKSSQISLGQGSTINGSIVSNNDLEIIRLSTINGLVYVKNSSDIKMSVTLNGCIWSSSFEGNTTEQQLTINWTPSYIPNPLPPGVTEPQSTTLVALQNSWKEL